MDATQAAILAKVQPAELVEQPLVTNNRDFNWVTDKICRIVETPTPIWWWVCMAVALMTAAFTGIGLLWLVSTGVGVWGLANPINWGWAIVNFVFWIGIGHAGSDLRSGNQERHANAAFVEPTLAMSQGAIAGCNPALGAQAAARQAAVIRGYHDHSLVV